MHAKPRRHGGGDTYHGTNLRVSFDRKPGAIVLECEVAGPPSAKGRTVYIVFEADDLTDALKALRDEAIRARSQPLKESGDCEFEQAVEAIREAEREAAKHLNDRIG